MSGPRGSMALLTVILFLASAGVSALAVPGYAITGTPSLDVPDRTVSYQGGQYTVESITRVTGDDSFTVDLDVPDGTDYEVYFRGPDNQLISSARHTGDATQTIEYFGTGEAGTYAVTIRADNEVKAVYPVVLSGYDVTVDAPATVATGDSLTVSADLSERQRERHSELAAVQVVVGGPSVERQVEMQWRADGEYTATLSTDGLSPGAYDLYVLVRGDATVRQRAEMLAVSDLTELTVRERTTGTTAGGTATPGATTGTPSTVVPTAQTRTGTDASGGSTVAATATTAVQTGTPSVTDDRATEATSVTNDGTAEPTATGATSESADATTTVAGEQTTATTARTELTRSSEDERGGTATNERTTENGDSSTEANGGVTTTNANVIQPESPTSTTPTSATGPGFTFTFTAVVLWVLAVLGLRRR